MRRAGGQRGVGRRNNTGHEETFGCDGYVHFLTDRMGIHVCQMDQLVPFKYAQFIDYRIFLNRTIF